MTTPSIDEATQPPDDELVGRSLQGELAAFNQIVERYQSRVFNVSARILGDRAAAEDITQETFISAHRALGGFRGGSLRAWLLRIASNHSYDYLRSSKRKREQSLDEALERPGFREPSGGRSPEGEAEACELRDEIQKAILELPLDQRVALVLVDVQGFGYQETAEAVGASLGTVKSRLSRARGRVRDHMMRHRELLPGSLRQPSR